MANLNTRSLFRSLLVLASNLVPSLAHPTNITISSNDISSLSWQNCTSDFFGPLAEAAAGIVLPGMQCSTLSVPLDWAKPHGNRISLSLNRLQASNQTARIGSLILNPGGPGGSGVEYLAGIALGEIYISPAVLESFDLVGFDPRGVGLSSPLKCDKTIYNERVSLFPQDEASFEQLVKHNRAFGESCLNRTGELFYHVDTTSAARDIEAIRLALDDGKLNYLGGSYGTQLGAAYAELFPHNIRAMVLDAALDHDLSETNVLFTSTQTSELALTRFFSWCDNSTDCALHGSNTSSAQLFDALVAKANVSPIPALECNGTCRSDVNGEEILFRVTASLTYKALSYPYNQALPTWQNLSTAIAAAIAGDGSGLSVTLATEDTGFAVTSWNGLGVGCLDWPHNSHSMTDILYKSTMLSLFPHTHGANQMWQYQIQCIGWPSRVTNPPHSANVHGAPPILIVHSLYDPECAYVWAEGLRRQIEGAVLVTRNGDGHTSYGLGGQASRIVDAYLLDLTVPEQNLIVES